MNIEELKALADQCICHPASRGIADIEAAGEGLKVLIAQLEDAQGEIRALRATEAGLLCRLKAFEDVCRVFDDYLNGPTAWDQAQVDELNDRIGALLEQQK